MFGYLLLFVIAVVSAVAVYASRASATWRFTFLYRWSWLRARWGQWRAAGTMPHRIASALAASSPSAPLPPPAELIAWAESFLGAAGKLQHVEVSGDGLGGGSLGAMFKLLLTWDDDSAYNVDNIARPRSLVVKTLTPGFARRLTSILLGNAREAHFYRNFASNLATFDSTTERQEVRSVVPRVYHADGSWTTGDFVVVMEDLSTTGGRLGRHVLGNQCWGPVKGFPAELQTESVGLQMIEQVFAAMADVHAAFWRDESLLGHSWLKAAEWLQGRDRARWELAIDGMRNKWLGVKRTIEQGKTGVKWSDEVVRAMDDSLAATSWETYQRSFDVTKPTTPFTLCHGDFHAANILWVPGRERTAEDGEGDGARVGSKVYMVDWPEVGVACPFTELAQFMISNASPELRRKHERRLFADYHARLVAKGVCGRTFPLEACWERYQRGGIERWLQMLTLMTLFGLPDASVGWFHDQVAAFVHDHHADASASLKGRSIPFMSAYPLVNV